MLIKHYFTYFTSYIIKIHGWLASMIFYAAYLDFTTKVLEQPYFMHFSLFLYLMSLVSLLDKKCIFPTLTSTFFLSNLLYPFKGSHVLKKGPQILFCWLPLISGWLMKTIVGFVNREQWKIGCNKCKPRNRRWYLVLSLMMKFELPGFKTSKCFSHRIIYHEPDLSFSFFFLIYLSLILSFRSRTRMKLTLYRW